MPSEAVGIAVDKLLSASPKNLLLPLQMVVELKISADAVEGFTFGGVKLLKLAIVPEKCSKR